MGGNIFKGFYKTIAISLEDVLPTVRWLEIITNLNLIDNLIGSTGKKNFSNDIDLAIDQEIISKEQLTSVLLKWISKHNYNATDFIRKSGICVHFKSPISGNINKGFVQIDFMFVDDVEFIKFSLSADANSSFNGADRNMLISSIAKSMPGDFKYSWQKGLIQRSTGELISKDPTYIAQFLLGNTYSKKNLNNVESIIDAIKSDSLRQTNILNLIQRLQESKNKIDLQESERLSNLFFS